MKLGLTQVKIAQVLGIPLKTYRCYEYGTSHPMLAMYLKLAELYGWDIRRDPNYLFYKDYQRNYNRMQYRKRRYAYTNAELSLELKVSEESVRHVIKKKREASVENYARVMEVFAEETRLSEFRQTHN